MKRVAQRSRRSWLTLLPLLAFGVMALVFWRGLSGDPSAIPSALVGKPVPEFALAPVPGLMRDGKPVPGLSAGDLKQGEVSVVNVWASWCAPCRLEHPLLMAAGRRVPIFGSSASTRRTIRTMPPAFSAHWASPSPRSAPIAIGRVSLDWGVYGVPETFIVDGDGFIRFKWIGPLTAEAVTKILDPEIEKARAKLKRGGVP